MKPTLTLLAALLLSPLAALQAGKPNILHIHTDDHRPDGLRALGNPLLITPNLDSLVDRGMTFTRCYTMGSMSGAVCAPSRAMLLTGRSWLRIPREHAAAANASDSSTFLPRVMQAAGYQTWHMGKAGEVNAFGTGLKHFETTIAEEGKGGERAGSSRRLADRTIDFLKSRDTGGETRPFYAYLAFYLMDLYPTFAEFAGAKIPDGVEGKSIVPILTGKQPKVRDVLYTAYRHCQRAIRDDRWKLIRYPLVDRTQLFDLSNDPLELNNLAAKPEHAAKIAELTGLLQKEMADHADTTPLTVANPQPAEWTPPSPNDKPAKKNREAIPPATAQPGGRIRKDSKLHFTNWDTNKDDAATLEEFRLGQKNRRGLEAQFKQFDKNIDGKLSREEYIDPRAK